METNINVKNLDQLNGQQLYSLIHEIIDEICNICRLKTTKYVPNVWSTEQQFNQIVVYLKNLLSNLIDIRGKQECLQVFAEEVQKVIKECLEVRRAELRKAIINNTIANNNPILKDFFWTLNVVLDSDRVIDINQPLLQLDLNIADSKDGTTKETIVSMEFNREELSEVIKTLEEGQQEFRQSY